MGESTVIVSKSDLGRRITAARKALYYTRMQVAIAIGAEVGEVIGEGGYAQWERGDRMPNITVIPAICAVLRITPEYLLGMPEKGGLSSEESLLLQRYRSIEHEELRHMVLEVAEKYASLTERFRMVAARNNPDRRMGGLEPASS